MYYLFHIFFICNFIIWKNLQRSQKRGSNAQKCDLDLRRAKVVDLTFFCLSICFSHNWRAQGFHSHFKSLLKDNMWSQMEPVDSEPQCKSRCLSAEQLHSNIKNTTICSTLKCHEGNFVISSIEVNIFVLIVTLKNGQKIPELLILTPKWKPGGAQNN